MYFLFRSMRISFVSKVTRLHKAVTVANNTSLCSTILVVSWIHFGRPGWNFPYEHTTEFVPVSEPARLPGSYEEALNPKVSNPAQIEMVTWEKSALLIKPLGISETGRGGRYKIESGHFLSFLHGGLVTITFLFSWCKLGIKHNINTTLLKTVYLIVYLSAK